MTAFLDLLDTYAIFFYIAGVVGVLLGIKMLFDARRAGRTTLFTLEQEQASDRAFRAVLVMLGSTLFIAAVAGVNAFVAPAVPETATDVAGQPTSVPNTPIVRLPSATPQPTLTLAPVTAGPTAAAVTQTPAGGGPTAVAAKPTIAPVQPTTPPQSPTPEAPPPTETVVSQLVYGAPQLNIPPNGDSIGAARIRFMWGVDAEGNQTLPATLTDPDRYYRLVITYTSKTTQQQAALVLCTKDSSVDTRTGVTAGDYRNEAVDNAFQWNVTVVSAASPDACAAGQYTPLSPTSATHAFVLP